MTTTQLIATVLPFSVDPTAPFHVSVFLTHRLVPDPPPPAGAQPPAELSQFPPMVDWITTLRAATFDLFVDNHPAPIPCRPSLDGTDSAAWQTVFPPTTAVAAFTSPTTTDKTWHSYPASRVPDHAVNAHYATALAAPARPPGVVNNPLATEILGYARTIDAPLGVVGNPQLSTSYRELLDSFDRYPSQRDAWRDAARKRGFADARASVAPAPVPPPPPPAGPKVIIADASAGPPEPDGTSATQPISPVETLGRTTGLDAAMTQKLDEALAPQPPDPPVPHIVGTSAALDDPAAAMLSDAHATARYYTRPEAQTPYQDTPTPGAHDPRPTPPARDFHKIAGSCSSTPALGRRLGLIVDLVVDDLNALKAATTIRCDITAAGVQRLLSPATKCQVSGNLLVATPDTDRWRDGRLAIGVPANYRVTDLDPDASGLKLEQHLRGVVRSYATELNGDPTTYAPATLRGGFAVAEIGRADAVRARVTDVENLQPIVDDGTQATAAKRANFGYEAVLRGLRVEVWDDVTNRWHSLHQRAITADVNGTTVLPASQDPGYLQNTPLSRVPGDATNPYYLHEVIAGWDGWGLAAPKPGLMVVHDYGQAGNAGNEHVTADQDAQAGGPAIHPTAEPGSLPALRYGRSYSFRVFGADLAGNTVVHSLDGGEPPNPAATAAAAAHLQHLVTDAANRDAKGLLEKLRPKLTPLPANGFVGEIHRAVHGIVRTATALRTRPQLSTAPELLARLATDTGDPTTVTTARPFLRWDSVPAPTVVPRHPYGTGESPLRLVLRTGIPAPDATTERHLLPPQTSQHDAELAGKFDALMQSANPDDRRRAYAIALKERGNLHHTQIQDLDNPTGTIPQPGVSLITPPTADPTTAVTLDQLQQPDTQPGQGQYVIHDVDQLTLPYLPDPMAAGVALVFYEAGAEHHLPNPPILQSVTIPYRGDWPQTQSLRIVVQDEPTLHAQVDGSVITVGLPPGEQVSVAVSSTLTLDNLNLLGLWQNHAVQDPAVTPADAAILQQAALDGWLWWLTPSHRLRLVHATPRPAIPPALTDLRATPRVSGAVTAELLGVADVHGASTDRVELRANWTEVVDDPAAPAPSTVTHSQVVSKFTTADNDTSVLFTTKEFPTTGPDAVTVPQHPVVHTLPDTRFRRVDYQLHGSSRYREFFTPDQLPPPDDPQSAGNTRTVGHLSCAAPHIPVVRDFIPLFHWIEQTEPDHPFAYQRTRGSGVRIWLDRPWYSSGEGEQLAILTADTIAAAGTASDTSVWGRDAAFTGTTPASETDLPLGPGWERRALQLDVHPIAQPGKAVRHILTSGTPDNGVHAYIYQPEYHPGRRLWFVDAIFDASDIIWPFLKLAVARYQPNAIPDAEFSPTVVTDWVQLMPHRVSTISRPDDATVRVTTTGAYGINNIPALSNIPATTDLAATHTAWLNATRKVVATLQQLPDPTSSDLQWNTVSQAECTVEGVDPNAFQATWSGALTLTPAITLATPGPDTQTRVLIEEYELLPTDPKPGQAGPALTSRLVYADHLAL